MQIEENLARCATCGFISQESHVRRHMKQVHQSPVQVRKNLNDLNGNDDQIEGFSQNDEFADDTWSQNNELETDVFEEENVEMFQAPMDENNESFEKLHWTTSQVLLLIQLYDQHKSKFDDKKTRNKTIWRSIADEIRKVSKCNVSSEQCENKFKNLKKMYKKIVDNNNSTGRGAKSWPFFREMDLIFCKDPDVNPVSTCSNLEGSLSYMSTQIDQENTPHESVQTNTKGIKRKKPEEEPEWFKRFRDDCQKRHEERMSRQDSLLKILEKLAEK